VRCRVIYAIAIAMASLFDTSIVASLSHDLLIAREKNEVKALSFLLH
jgi:hypothetical protein